MFDELTGWLRLPSLLTSDEVAQINSACDELLRLPASERRAGDKPAAGTRHLFELDDRIPLVADLVNRRELSEPLHAVLGEDRRVEQVSYRCPQPGFGTQALHADDAPLVAVDMPANGATLIVGLVDFDEFNGATRLVPGSHRRLDLQRQSGRLERQVDEISLTGPAGTGYLFSCHVLHSGTKNESANERPALQITWRRGERPTGV